MKFYQVKKIILLTLLVSAIFVSGYILGANGFKIETGRFPKVVIDRNIPQKYQDVDFALFWKVWDTLDTSYFDKTKLISSKMVYGAISGMVSSIGDPYTSFLPPDENKVVEEDLSGSFDGVGIQIGFKGRNLAVIAPLPDSPAEKAGVQAGDFIVGIKDESKGIDTVTTGISLTDAVKIIRGKSGTKVTLFLSREDQVEPIVVDLIRATLDVPSVILNIVNDGKTAHLRLLKFGADTDSEWMKSINEITKNLSVESLILDLRNNPGGYLQGSVDIAGSFMKKGSIVVIEDGKGKRNEFKTDRNPTLEKYRVVVLINKGSASASEILAGALKENLGIKLIGETTFGKGTIQEPLKINGGAGLHITTARWLTPKGNWIHDKGLEPDIVVEDNSQTTEDEQLQEAIKELAN